MNQPTCTNTRNTETAACKGSWLKLRRTQWTLTMVSAAAILLTALQFTPLHGVAVGLAPFTLLTIFLAAFFCEFMDSSLGMGYGTTLTPLLLLLGFPPLEIVPAVLFSELLTGIFAVSMHQRDGNVDFLNDSQAKKTALLLASLSSIGGVFAVWIAINISRFWLSIFITAIILAMGIIILLTRTRKIPYRRSSIMVVGAIAAFNKSLSGGGYGPMVTAGQVVSGLPAKHAVAITSLSESFTCLIGLLAYLAAGKSIAWELALPLTFGALLSVPFATLAVQRNSEARLRSTVGLVTLVLGLAALAKFFP